MVKNICENLPRKRQLRNSEDEKRLMQRQKVRIIQQKNFFVAFLKFLFNISFALISLFSLQNFKLVASLLTGVIVSGSFSCQRPPEMSSEDHAKIPIEILHVIYFCFLKKVLNC